MKTTLEIPDAVFRKAKARAAEEGIPLRQFVTDAVKAKLRKEPPGPQGEKPWMKCFGALRHLKDETAQIQKAIDDEFETIEPEMWR